MGLDNNIYRWNQHNSWWKYFDNVKMFRGMPCERPRPTMARNDDVDKNEEQTLQ